MRTHKINAEIRIHRDEEMNGKALPATMECRLLALA
jgi:hypothetical protein